jgi:hypothetical protein
MKMQEDDEIPTIETYRGVGIHDRQSRHRIDRVVKPEIDHVIDASSTAILAAWARDITKSPESRLLAAAKIIATFEIATAERRVRPEIDLEVIAASVAGLNSQRWRDHVSFCSALDVPAAPGQPGPARRDQPLVGD